MSVHSVSDFTTACTLTLDLHFINLKIFSCCSYMKFSPPGFTVWNRYNFQIKMSSHMQGER